MTDKNIKSNYNAYDGDLSVKDGVSPAIGQNSLPDLIRPIHRPISLLKWYNNLYIPAICKPASKRDLEICCVVRIQRFLSSRTLPNML